MQLAAGKFVASLSPELKKKGMFDFADAQRTKWFFTPQQDKEKNYTRKGARYMYDIIQSATCSPARSS